MNQMNYKGLVQWVYDFVEWSVVGSSLPVDVHRHVLQWHTSRLDTHETHLVNNKRQKDGACRRSVYICLKPFNWHSQPLVRWLSMLCQISMWEIVRLTLTV